MWQPHFLLYLIPEFDRRNIIYFVFLLYAFVRHCIIQGVISGVVMVIGMQYAFPLNKPYKKKSPASQNLSGRKWIYFSSIQPRNVCNFCMSPSSRSCSRLKMLIRSVSSPAPVKNSCGLRRGIHRCAEIRALRAMPCRLKYCAFPTVVKPLISNKNVQNRPESEQFREMLGVFYFQKQIRKPGAGKEVMQMPRMPKYLKRE